MGANGDGVRGLRFTLGFAALLATSIGVLSTLGRDTRAAVLQAASTNQANLAAWRLDTLATSAALVEHPDTSLLSLALALGQGERALGTGATAALFALGHVGATAAVAAALAADRLPGSSAERVRTAVDVGPSYGVYAVVGVAAVVRPWPGPVLTAAAVLGLSLGDVRHRRGFTDWGHLVAVLTGLGTGAVLRHAVTRTQ